MGNSFSVFVMRLRDLQGEDSVSAFARRLQIKQQTLDACIKGQRKPSAELIYKVACNCHVSADWLLGLTNQRSPFIEAPRENKVSKTAGNEDKFSSFIRPICRSVRQYYKGITNGAEKQEPKDQEMKIERNIAEQLKAVLEGYEEQINDYANRNDQKNTRYINGVRRGFCRALQMLDVAGIEVDQVPVVRNGMHVDCVSFDVNRASAEPDPRDWTEREILNVISIRCKELEDYVETNRICKHKILSAGAKKMMSGLMAKLGKIIEYCDASFSLNGDETKEK